EGAAVQRRGGIWRAQLAFGPSEAVDHELVDDGVAEPVGRGLGAGPESELLAAGTRHGVRSPDGAAVGLDAELVAPAAELLDGELGRVQVGADLDLCQRVFALVEEAVVVGAAVKRAGAVQVLRGGLVLEEVILATAEPGDEG